MEGKTGKMRRGSAVKKNEILFLLSIFAGGQVQGSGPGKKTR